MEIIHGNEENFESLIKDDLVLVDFFATWCGPCKMLGPVLENIASSRNNTKIVKIDIDQNMDLARKFGIMSGPTMILFKNGNQVSLKNGFVPEEQLNNLIEENK